MLNSAVKERERVVEVAAETESLERLVGDGTRGLRGATHIVHPQLDVPPSWDGECTLTRSCGAQMGSVL